MYNTQFNVKYYDIKEELTMKLKCETEEYEYSVDDVMDICNKLYRDELLSVFWAENFMDDKLDNGLKYVYETMMKNDKFKDIISQKTKELNLPLDIFSLLEILNYRHLKGFLSMFKL